MVIGTYRIVGTWADWKLLAIHFWVLLARRRKTSPDGSRAESGDGELTYRSTCGFREMRGARVVRRPRPSPNALVLVLTSSCIAAPGWRGSLLIVPDIRVLPCSKSKQEPGGPPRCQQTQKARRKGPSPSQGRDAGSEGQKQGKGQLWPGVTEGGGGVAAGQVRAVQSSKQVETSPNSGARVSCRDVTRARCQVKSSFVLGSLDMRSPRQSDEYSCRTTPSLKHSPPRDWTFRGHCVKAIDLEVPGAPHRSI